MDTGFSPWARFPKTLWSLWVNVSLKVLGAFPGVSALLSYYPLENCPLRWFTTMLNVTLDSVTEGR